MPLSILDEDNLMIDDSEAVSPSATKASRKNHYANTSKTNTMSRKINVVPQSMVGLRTVANKLPESHLSKVPLDKLLSYNTSTAQAKKDFGRISDLQGSSLRS